MHARNRHARTHACTHAHTHKHTHARTNARTHAHTHAHTIQSPRLLLISRNLVPTKMIHLITVQFLTSIPYKRYYSDYSSHISFFISLLLLTLIHISQPIADLIPLRLPSFPALIICTIDRHESTILVFVDLSADFDTNDHHILISRLHTSFGISGTPVQWITSYLSDRSQVVDIGLAYSPASASSSVVPQESVLGPIWFSLYIALIAPLVSHHGAL